MLPLLLCLKEKWKNREEKEGGIRYKDELPPSRLRRVNLRRFSPNESVTDGDDFKRLSKRETSSSCCRDLYSKAPSPRKLD